MAGTGSVGYLQRFRAVLESNWNKQLCNQGKKEKIGTILSKSAIDDFMLTHRLYTPIPSIPNFSFGALFAFYCHNEFHLMEFDQEKFEPEFKENHSIWYASMGSGMSIADPFLGLIKSIFWKDEKRPNLAYGRLFAYWIIQHAIPGGINGPVQISIL